MRTTPFLLLNASLSLTLACSDQSSPIAADTAMPQRTWASDRASLTIKDSGAGVRILASGCVGSYGHIVGPIPPGRFSLPGTYTQLIGAYPGRVKYSARYGGLWDGNHLTLTISVATLPEPVGPFHLRSGVRPTWRPCRYP